MRVLALLCVCFLFIGCAGPKKAVREKATFSSFDTRIRTGKERFPPGNIVLQQASADTALAVYSQLSGRATIRSPQVPMNMAITVSNVSPVTRIEALQMIDTAFAAHGVALLYTGDHLVRAVPAAMAASEAGPVIDLPAEQLPESKSFMVRHVKLRNLTANEVTGAIQAFASVPNSIVALGDRKVLYLRDYSVNIRQMLRIIEELEASARQKKTPAAGSRL